MDELELARIIANNQQAAIENFDTSPIRSLNETTNELFGSNFRQGEAIANQRALMLTGQNEQTQGLKAQLDLQNKAAADEAKILKERLKAEREVAGFERDQAREKRAIEKHEADLAKTRAQTAKASRLPTSKSKGDSDDRSDISSISRDNGLEVFLTDVASKKFKGNTTKTKVTERALGKLDDISKTFTKELSINSRAQGVLASVKKAREQAARGENNTATLGAIVNQLAKASGEVGALTEADKAAFRGAQDLRSKLSRFFATNFKGKIEDKDLRDFENLANLFSNESRTRITRQSQSQVRRLKIGLGLSDADLIDAGILEYLGDGIDLGDGDVLKVDPRVLGLRLDGSKRFKEKKAKEDADKEDLDSIINEVSTTNTAQPQIQESEIDDIVNGII